VDSDIVMEGVLLKRGASRSASQKRWFAVDSRHLYSFKDAMVGPFYYKIFFYLLIF
jgi:hypothetical protein